MDISRCCRAPGHLLLHVDRQRRCITAVVSDPTAFRLVEGIEEQQIRARRRRRRTLHAPLVLKVVPYRVDIEGAVVNPQLVHQAIEESLAGQTVGYLNFRNFVEPSFESLRDAFAQFTTAGVDALVLDLRYNGGFAVLWREDGNKTGAEG